MQNKPIIVSKENYLYYVKNTRNIKKGEPVEGASLYELVKYLKDNKNIDKILQFIKKIDIFFFFCATTLYYII